jgi:hypothetical protein
MTQTLHAAKVVDGSLGLWISNEASPHLAEILTNHPRFKGEKIKIMAMKDGHPSSIKNSLTEQIRKQLTEDLLTLADVKIVFDDINRCQPIRVSTILGIEIERHNDRDHRVSLAFVDIDEGIWLSGTNISWVGRTTNDQLKAYKSVASSSNQVPVFHPSETSGMATALHDQLKCKENIVAPIFFQLPEDEPGLTVLRKLQERIANRALITLDKTRAATVITLTSADREGVAGTLFLEATDTSTANYSMRIAEVKLTNSYQPLRSVSQPDDSAELISAINFNENRSREDVCKDGNRKCLPVSFSLTQPAYTLLFYTIQGKVTLLNCKVPKRQNAGKYNYGLNVPALDSQSTPALGFYALAFKDRKTARPFYQLFNKNSSGCRSSDHHHNQAGDQNIEWLTSLETLIYQYKAKSDWAAIHLAWHDDRIKQL